MPLKTSILYIVGFLISVSIWSAFGLFSEHRYVENSNQLFIFLFSLLLISFPNFIFDFILTLRGRIFNSVIKGNKEKIISFINKGGNINKQDIHGYSLLHYAIIKNNIEIINLLIKNQVDINQKNKQGNTALHLAASYGHFNVVKLLLENGACVNICNKNNQTPLNLLRENYFLTLSQETKNDIINLLKEYEAK